MPKLTKAYKYALSRYNACLDALEASELTIVHHTPGEDGCCEDVKEAKQRKKILARDMAIVAIDLEISNHSTIALVLRARKIRNLSEQKQVLRTLL